MILGVFSQLKGFGGIQQVSRHAGATLCELAGRTKEPCELIGLNDQEGEGSFRVGSKPYRFRGFSRNKFRFTRYMMVRARKTRILFANHIHFGPPALAARVIGPHLRYWLVAHGFEVWPRLPLYRAIPLRKADGVVAVSRNTAEALERVQGVSREKIFVHPPALEPDDGTPHHDLHLAVPPESRFLLTVARLAASEPGKGVDTVIRSLPRLLTEFPNLYYVIVGDGDARTWLEKLAVEKGVAARVIFVGECTREMLCRYYEAADVFVMPSRQEGFGIVFLEAMAAGKPVVAADCGGAPEVVREGEDGFLVKYGDAPVLAARLASLLGDDRLRQRMGDTGRRKIDERHRFEQFCEGLISILEGGHGRAPDPT